MSFSGIRIEGVTPLPIPNREVKLLCADGTMRVTAWESRSMPVPIQLNLALFAKFIVELRIPHLFCRNLILNPVSKKFRTEFSFSIYLFRDGKYHCE